MRIVDAHRIENLLQMCGSYHGVIAYDTVISILHDAPTVYVPRWIPVSERLPKHGEKVLCCVDGRLYIDERGLRGWRYRVTPYDAWMPLPEPFREGGENG